MVKEPLDVFAILEQRDIGIMVATYYEAKAECLVKRRRFKEATETYELGIRRYMINTQSHSCKDIIINIPLGVPNLWLG